MRDRKKQNSQIYQQLDVIEEASTIPTENFKYTEELKLLEHILKQNPNTECFSYLVKEKNSHEEAFYHKL